MREIFHILARETDKMSIYNKFDARLHVASGRKARAERLATGMRIHDGRREMTAADIGSLQ